jgi:hypothetical protein
VRPAIGMHRRQPVGPTSFRILKALPGFRPPRRFRAVGQRLLGDWRPFCYLIILKASRPGVPREESQQI